ncbi:hypothetical protein FJ251_12485, partial [bacterium]|nr:hypothetical protein [bacterium]
MALSVAVLLAGSGCALHQSALDPGADPAPAFPLKTGALQRGDRVELELTDGSRVAGQVLSFRPDSLILRVPRDANAAADRFRRGEVAGERSAVALSAIRGGLRFREVGGLDWPFLAVL